MIREKIVITNPSGLHLRPAGLLCQTAIGFKCHITFRINNNVAINAKSVLSILGACIKRGDEVELICDGEDELSALYTISKLIKSGLGEVEHE